MSPRELPVFFDRTGRRWRIIKISAISFVTTAGFFLLWLMPQILSGEYIPAFYMPAATHLTFTPNEKTLASNNIETLANIINARNIPIISEGPLVRVVRIEKNNNRVVAVDPFTNTVTRELNKQEVMEVNANDYAMERYGKTQGKRIALTFDDGPDPMYTPQLLDLLSRESAAASFFVVGGNVVKYPEITQRIVREGHILGNHSFNHVNFDFTTPQQAYQEINQTQRVIRATANRNTAYFRLPYGGNTDQEFRNSVKGFLQAQKLGYTITSYDYDSNDWQFTNGRKPTFPDLNGSDIVMLLHDAGGDRTHTLAYVEQLIKNAKAKGYEFVTLEVLYPQPSPLFARVTPNIADRASLFTAQSILVWPRQLVVKLFLLSVGSVLLSTVINVTLATLHRRRTKYKRRARGYEPLVSILIPAYNEQEVLKRTVKSLLRSRYKNSEILIIDDGSTDNTWHIATEFAIQYKQRRVYAMHQPNGGKAKALNYGLHKAKGEIVICVDADTIFPPQTVTKLIRHFIDPNVGAVAGMVKVGNVRNMLTRWQALEYTIGINIERNAQAYLGAVMVVPGACGAWRKKAIFSAHGYSHHTLAEDCDLTLAIHKAGHKVIQDNEAIGYTEAPQSVRILAKQRFRWTFGNIQSYWKHRDLLFQKKYGWLGIFILPNAMVNILIPLVFLPLLVTITLENLAAGQYAVILLFLAITMALQLFLGIVGIIFAKERFSYLLAVPMTRLVYGPLRTYLLYRSAVTALKGVYVGWNKFARTGTVAYYQSTAMPALKKKSRARARA